MLLQIFNLDRYMLGHSYLHTADHICCCASTYHYAHTQHRDLRRGGQSPISRSVHAMGTRNTCVVPVGAATTKHLIMHAAYALSFDTTEGFWCVHMPLCAHATLAGGWAATNYQISTRYGAQATLAYYQWALQPSSI
jgi:hypothetical protein